ncbi:MAG: DUF4340 domain-containing protein [Verrucomicrobia bacterium]|nr:DUF4340 domain-containing protein [Verrucomicrobiota bacterium]MBU4247411.1 DUF4340 domain-containing protein [Verrucomicrobiota bacterium]MBU4290949.1 DUF4340 domain-containing protein [Verrucomicrobiota bacterium]MBU4497794.1 DUF4340 domain-containing protein [Verrucomicrobiota bacterium]MCG2681671.1 DUF4340 domain-containing protein [Kiritimatiellia bacterium]
MKLKTFVILIVLAVLLGGMAYWTVQNKTAAMPPVIGSKVLPPFPLNEVSKILILSSGTNITVAKTQGIWTVASRFNYPAKFATIVESLRELSDLKVGQAMAVTESELGQFSLLAPAPNVTSNAIGQTGTLLQLLNEKNQMLASLLIGKHFMHQAPAGAPANPMMGMGAYPDGQYVRTGKDQVFLVAKTLDRLTDNAKSWMDDEFINVPAQDIVEMTVTGPDCIPIILRRAKDDDPLILDGLRADEGTADPAKISQLSGGLNYLGFDDIAAPTLTAKETGLDRAIVIKARTRKGRLYTLSIGNTLTNDTFDRYMQVSVAYEPPAAAQTATNKAETSSAETKSDPADAQKKKDEETKIFTEQTQALNSKLSPWIYVLKSYRAESLLVKRDDLIKKPEPPRKDEAADTAAPPADAGPAKASAPGKDNGQGK